MSDFLLDNYTLITHSVEAIAALTGIILFNKYKGTFSKYFIYFLIYLSVCDLINNYPKFIRNDGILSFLKGTVFELNYWWSTLFWNIGAILFFAFFYNKILKTILYKNILKFTGLIFFAISFICILLNWDVYFTNFFPIISISGAVVIFLCTGFYFIELLQSNKILTFYKSLNFYISLAIFIWWLIITPIVFYDVYDINGANKDLDYYFLRRYIYLFVNVFMYSTFTFALIWCRPQDD